MRLRYNGRSFVGEGNKDAGASGQLVNSEASFNERRNIQNRNYTVSCKNGIMMRTNRTIGFSIRLYVFRNNKKRRRFSGRFRKLFTDVVMMMPNLHGRCNERIQYNVEYCKKEAVCRRNIQLYFLHQSCKYSQPAFIRNRFMQI